MIETPRGNRIHIGFFGRRNAGKSSLINALTEQDVSIVSEKAGTTTDPVMKSMELHPIGPVVFIDTAGLDDEGSLGSKRTEKTGDIMARTDIAIVVIDGSDPAVDLSGDPAGDLSSDLAGDHAGDGIKAISKGQIPVIKVVNKSDLLDAAQREALEKCLTADKDQNGELIFTSAQTGEGIDSLRQKIIDEAAKIVSEDDFIHAGLPEKGLVLLVMPQDIQAPKGRLILPQVQTIRALLDRKCTVVSATADGFGSAIQALAQKPDLIITDSQCFKQVWEGRPEATPVTSFSILMAKIKGDIDVLTDGAKAIDDLKEKARADDGREAAGIRILIAEACTHVPQGEDIGTVKIPRMLRERLGEAVEIVNVRGSNFPDIETLRGFDLVIHCGGCMFNRSHMMSRIAAAKEAGVPITNYGVLLARINGIMVESRES